MEIVEFKWFIIGLSGVFFQFSVPISHHTSWIEVNMKAHTITKKKKAVQDGVFKAELNNFLMKELAEDGYSGVEVCQSDLKSRKVLSDQIQRTWFRLKMPDFTLMKCQTHLFVLKNCKVHPLELLILNVF